MNDHHKYNPDSSSPHPSQWTSFKSKKEKKEESKQHKQDESHAAAPHNPQSHANSHSTHTKHTITHPAYTSHSAHNSTHAKHTTSHTKSVPPPLHPGAHHKKHRRLGKGSKSSDSLLLIMLGSLGVILIAVGVYYFKDSILDSVPKLVDLQIDQNNPVAVDKADLKDNILLTSYEYLKKYDTKTQELSPVDKYTTAIPGDLYLVQPNKTNDVFLLASSQQQGNIAENNYYFLNLNKQQLQPFNNNSLQTEQGNMQIDSAIWNQGGTSLIVSHITGLAAGDNRNYKVSVVNPADLSVTPITEFTGSKLNLLYADQEMVVVNLTTASTSINNPGEENAEEITTTKSEIIAYDLNKKTVTTVEPDSAGRIQAVGGTHYALLNGTQITFKPYKQTAGLRSFTINPSANSRPNYLAWSPDGQTFALMMRDQNENHQVLFYDATGKALATLPVQLGAAVLYAEDGSAVITQSTTTAANQLTVQGSPSNQIIEVLNVDPTTAEVLAKHQIIAQSPMVWTWIK